jgi:D-amino-acid dehydrogenase
MGKIVVIGGGVIGHCTAYYAARRGHQVTVLDRNAEDHPGCSHGNAGMIVPSHCVPLAAPGAVALGLKWMLNPESPFWIKPRFDIDLFGWAMKFWRASNTGHVRRSAPVLRDLHLASRECFEQLEAQPGIDFGLTTRGLVMLCKTEHALEEEIKAALEARKLGIPAEILAPNETAELDPGVRLSITGSVFYPKDCHLDPSRFMAVLKGLLKKELVEFRFREEATGFEQDGARVQSVRTTGGHLEADEFVICGGSWSSNLARELDLKIPMQAGKGYSLTLPKPRQLPNLCAIFTEARLAVTPMGSSLRFGGTMEMAGLNEEINPRRVQGIIKSVPQYYPEFRAEDFAEIQPWRGLRPCSPDGLPYLGRTRKYSNLSIATGHAMMGLSLGPISGKLIAEILSGEPPSINIDLLNPDRYGG